jgi:hypothetical protein
MSDYKTIYIGAPQANTEEGELLLKLAEELDINWSRKVTIDGEDNIELNRKSTATIDLPKEV